MSHLQSYLTFCKLHNHPICPTIDTLSLFVVFMCHHINPKSVSAYLSRICNTLELHFPNIHTIRLNPLVVQTLSGMKKLHRGLTLHCCHLLTEEDLLLLLARYDTNSYDDCLFLAIVFCGFHMLLRVGELTDPDSVAKRSFLKTTLRNTLNIWSDRYSYHLPYHKGDHFFEGNIVMVLSVLQASRCPVNWMKRYIMLRDAHFPLLPELWLTSIGCTPTYTWVISRLRTTLDNEVRGHSLRSGGATALALAGASDDVIQSMGRWASDTFRIYIRKHLVLLHALIHNNATPSTDV